MRIAAVLFALVSMFSQVVYGNDVESRPIVVRNKFSTVLAMLYLPKQPKKIAIVEDKPWSNEIASFSETAPLAEKGYPVLVVNPRPERSSTTLESIVLDIAAGVQEMKDRGYQNIVLMVGSGASPSVSLYQNVAENGNAAFAGDRKIFKFPGYFEKDGTTPMRLPKAVGIIFRSPMDGSSTTFLSRLDPSVIDETSNERDPSLDMFNPANGYDPKTKSGKYSKEFVEKYGKGQAARLNRLTEIALKKLAAAKEGKSPYGNDDLMVIPRTQSRIYSANMQIGDGIGKYLILPDNVIAVPKSDRLPTGNPGPNSSVNAVTDTSCRGFLSRLAIQATTYNPAAARAADWGVDVESSNNTLIGNLRHVTVPLIIMIGSADSDDRIPAAEMAYNEAASKDKKLIILRGGTHHLESVDPKRFPSSETIRGLLESEMAKWIGERFSGTP